MNPRAIRFSETITKQIEAAAKDQGFASASAFIRYAVEQELSGRQDGLTGAEERLAASIEQVRKDLYRLMRVQQALFAYVDTLAKTILTCVPEPPADAKPQAVARAKERYDRLLKMLGVRWSGMPSSRCRIWL
ncbi:MAG TPA: hypothetical protein VFB14_26050 [Bryobacteraceae bacterium]|jgi:Arc/MetJ-type ribon-helix-helix transcriptional regulator|nr:hypothetical protein [Bryobacteraceae bacterium]